MAQQPRLNQRQSKYERDGAGRQSGLFGSCFHDEGRYLLRVLRHFLSAANGALAADAGFCHRTASTSVTDSRMAKLLLTGAAGYIAAQILPTLRERYDVTCVDVTGETRDGEAIEGLVVADLIDADRTKYASLFEGVDAVIHLGYKRRTGSPLDHYFDERQNVDMAYNVFRSALDAGVKRVVMASSNHAADWYEHALIHRGHMESLDPYLLPLSDNFYGWAKATYEHLGFLFASGMGDFTDASGKQTHTGGAQADLRRLEVVMVRIGAPRVLDLAVYDDPGGYKRDLGAWISPRDLTQLFVRSVDTEDIRNEHGVPWQVVYGISNNTRAFWSLTSARQALGYAPKDDSELEYAADIKSMLERAPGRVG